VAIGGQIVWVEAFGEADVLVHRPVTTATEFRIGSVSKSLTAVGAALLVEAGKLDLDAPIQRYVPTFPLKPWPITARELGGHLSGIRHYKGEEFLSDQPCDTVASGLAIFADDLLVHEPGTGYHYSSYGFNLLSAAMESAAGEPYLDYMREHVIGPLALTHTEPDRATSSIPQRTSFFVRRDDGTVAPAPHVDISCKWASGGYLSTPSDLVRFGSALLAPGFLTKASLDLLFTPQRTRDGKETEYGFGWEVSRDRHGRRWLWHTGGSVGGETALRMWPEGQLVVALVANARDAGPKHGEAIRAANRIANEFAEALSASTNRR
jgi:CubicO group peptidase (beta-lactamase class C family)